MGGAEELDLKGCEPRSGCTMGPHCEKRSLALAPPTQDHHRCQSEDSEESKFGAECWSGRHQDAEWFKGQQESLAALSQTFSVSEDLASSFDDLSVECLSADWEPNVSSLGSESQTEWDQTDQEEDDEDGDEVENYCYSNSFISTADYRSCSASQGSSSTSEPSHSATAAGAEGSVLILGTLPPSDSFADFCTAPTEGSEEGQWAEFRHHGAQVQTVESTFYNLPVMYQDTKTFFFSLSRPCPSAGCSSSSSTVFQRKSYLRRRRRMRGRCSVLEVTCLTPRRGKRLYTTIPHFTREDELNGEFFFLVPSGSLPSVLCS